MEKQSKLTLIVLDKVSTFIKNLSDEQIDNITSNKETITIITGSKVRRQNEKPKKIYLNDSDLHSILSALKNSFSREEGLKILNEKCQNRNSLERLARIIDIPVQKTDGIDKIRSKIIESTIGFRLRSRAIQGEPENKL